MPDHIQPLAVITGASSGIGRELAKLAAQKGYRLLLIRIKFHLTHDLCRTFLSRTVRNARQQQQVSQTAVMR